MLGATSFHPGPFPCLGFSPLSPEQAWWIAWRRSLRGGYCHSLGLCLCVLSLCVCLYEWACVFGGGLAPGSSRHTCIQFPHHLHLPAISSSPEVYKCLFFSPRDARSLHKLPCVVTLLASLALLLSHCESSISVFWKPCLCSLDFLLLWFFDACSLLLPSDSPPAASPASPACLLRVHPGPSPRPSLFPPLFQ